jgi:hypothetical protein
VLVKSSGVIASGLSPSAAIGFTTVGIVEALGLRVGISRAVVGAVRSTATDVQ